MTTDAHETEIAADETAAQAVDADASARSRLLRDAAMFQGKLVLDGLRDVVLFPVALVAAGVDLLKKEGPTGKHFYSVLHFGKETERWIDLFEAVERAPRTDAPRPTLDGSSLDRFVDDLERKLKAEYERGDLSASAREAVERAIDAVRGKR